MARVEPQGSNDPPRYLIVPGLNNSGPDHWQSLWERALLGAERVQLGMWDDPHRNTWANQLNLAIGSSGRPVVLIAHSLGCHAVATWAALEQPGPSSPVIGALLVAPPDVEDRTADERVRRFAPLHQQRLPFLSIVAASQNDRFASFASARRMARLWGSRLVDAGHLGHINAHSDIGDWPYGRYLLHCLESATMPLSGHETAETPATRYWSQLGRALVIGR